jgi:hypothetical protein
MKVVKLLTMTIKDQKEKRERERMRERPMGVRRLSSGVPVSCNS